MVLREWRRAEERSRAWLAGVSGIRPDHLARLERGDLYPDSETIATLAAAFNRSADEFCHDACVSFQQRARLYGLLEDLRIPRENWNEFFELDSSARDAFVRAIDARVPSTARRRIQLQAVEEAIARDGIEPTIPLLLEAIKELGLSPTDHFRATVELEEMPGERAVFTDRLPISPVSVPIDQLFLFRASYGLDPPNPMLLKWWAETRRTAMDASLEHHRSRTIMPIDRLEQYIRTGRRAPGLVISSEIVLEHVAAYIIRLRTRAHFRLGLATTSLPFTYRVKGDHHVLVTIYGRRGHGLESPLKTTLLFSRPSVVSRFIEHFNHVWEELPNERKEGGPVADWLEIQLTRAGEREHG